MPRSVAIGLALAAAALVAWIAFDPDPLAGQPFDAKVWKASKGPERAAMTRAAMNEVKRGLPERDIEELLGASDPNAYGPDKRAYAVGSWPGRYHPTTFLVIEFDSKRRVVQRYLDGY